jgi:putative ABC transport system permease protein
MSTAANGRALRIARRTLSVLLRLYPRAFREEFGRPVRDLVERDLAKATDRGLMALLRVATAHAVDIILSALRQRMSRRGGPPDGIVGAWSGWLRDSKYGARLLAKHRAFSAVVVITLALAIGANTVIFTFVNIMVLRPLPVREPATLGWVYNVGPQTQGDRSQLSMAEFLDFRARSRSFSALAARRLGTLTLVTEGADPERVRTIQVTANHLSVWGLTPRAGRLFEANADTPGAPPTVILSHQFWQRRFGADASIVGRAILLDGISHTVIGVLDPDIEIGNLSSIDVWTPLTLDLRGKQRHDRELSTVGRLAPGVTVEQADAEIRAIAKSLQQEHPGTNNGWDARVADTKEAMTGPGTWLVLTLLAVIVAFVLLIACANLANLMLARATERGREIAIRTALGAGRVVIVRQLIIESVLLGTVGGAFGLLVAYGGITLIKATAYEEFFALLSIDRNVVTFVTGITLLTSIFFSVVPALHASRADVAEVLKGASRSSSGARGVRRGRAVLVVSQVALALSLAVVAILVVRSMIKTTRIDLGFETRGLFAFRVDLPMTRYPADDALPSFYERALNELGAIPGVRSVAAANRAPVIGGESVGPVTIDGRVVSRPADQPWAASARASETFFATTRISIVAGRAFSRSDDATREPVAVVNREMAKRYWGTPEAAIGKRVALGGGARETLRWLTVVGVSADTKPTDYTLPPNPQVYVPIVQQPTRSVAFLIRAENTSSLASDVRAAMRRVDAGVAVYDARTFDESMSIDMSSSFVLTGMYIAFASIALSLAAAGLYGVMSYSVSQRTREVGIRVALGATGDEVLRMMLAQGGRLLLIGVPVGILGGALIGSTMRSLLYGVTPLDPSTYALVIALVVLVMGVATYVPARRATRVDPVRALRAE